MATNSLVLVALMVTLSCITFSSAKVYTVGDSAGWALSVDYATWASDKTFKVGDKLVFNYDSSHTVDLVTSSDYTTCAIGNSIASYNSGTTTIPLNTTGSHYFICGIMGHCSGGMKLSIDVTSNGSPLGAPLAAPSPITAESPITTPSGTTLPNPNAATGANNIPADSSSAALSTFATVVFSLVAFMSQLIGYFKGGRGLRQGDPLSPYLFTLVMEIFTLILTKKVQQSREFKYHAGCNELKITHICFADDLLVLCHGSIESVEVIRMALDQFSEMSGLKPNPSKSTLFFGSMRSEERKSIVDMLQFKEGSLPVRYLGVPLITKRLGILDCKQLLDRIKTTIGDWKNRYLSYAGRLQLVASVLSSMQVFWSSVFSLPLHIIHDIDKLLKGFLWCQGDLTRGKAKIAWKIVCKPKSKGGLGLRNIKEWNDAMLTKLIWNIVSHKDSLWVKWIHKVRLKGRSFWDVEADYSDSWMWRKLLDLRDKVRKHLVSRIGNGRNTSIWYDLWHSRGPLCNYITVRRMYEAGLHPQMRLSDLNVNGRIEWPEGWDVDYPELVNNDVVIFADREDRVSWRNLNGKEVEFSVTNVVKDFRCTEIDVDWSNLVWFTQGVPGHMFIMWVVMHGRLNTQERIMKWNKNVDMRCVFCDICPDSQDHLFFKCSYASKVWTGLAQFNFLGNISCNWEEVMRMYKKHCMSNSLSSVVGKLLLGAAVYYLWQERNRRVFQKVCRSADVLIETICNIIRMKMMDLKVKSTSNVLRIFQIWGIKPNIVVS